MSRLDQLISQYCPTGVPMVRMGEVCGKVKRGKRLTKSQLTETDLYPVYHGGNMPIGYYHEYNREADTVMIINVGASAGTVGFCDKKFWSSDGCFCINKTKGINDKYLYNALVFIESEIKSGVRNAGIPTLDNSIVENLSIPLPPLPVQEEIVRILDAMSDLVTNLDAEISARQKQYEHAREKLLTFGKEVERKTLGEVTHKSANIKWNQTKSIYRYVDLSSVDVETHLIGECSSIDYTNAPSRAQQIIYMDDVLFGTTRPLNKRYCIVPHSMNGQICSTGYCVLRPEKKLVVPRFLYYTISTSVFYEYVENKQSGANYPCISDKDVKAYPIPLPPLSVQQSIVERLDKMESLIQNLQAERALRQKQYEYYREKLLTFERT